MASHGMSREDTRKRDERIIKLLGYGIKPAQIAERLGISPRTVTDAKYRNSQAGVRRNWGKREMKA